MRSSRPIGVTRGSLRSFCVAAHSRAATTSLARSSASTCGEFATMERNLKQAKRLPP